MLTGFGILGALNETRGRSFSMGGDAGAITLPNFFKHFNPAIIGFSTGTYAAGISFSPQAIKENIYKKKQVH